MNRRDRLNALAKAYFALAAAHRDVAHDYSLIDSRREHHLRLATEMDEFGAGWTQGRITVIDVAAMRREAML